METSTRTRLLVACTGVASVVAYYWWQRRKAFQVNGMGVRISALYVYPIKSCQGLSVTEAELTPAGLCHDRAYMVVRITESQAVFMTQRELPQMALLCPVLHIGGKGLTAISAPGKRDLSVPLMGTGVVYDVMVHDRPSSGEDLGDTVATWLCDALGEPSGLRLLRNSEPTAIMKVDKYGHGLVRFADSSGMNVASDASLEDVERRSGIRNIVGRFRPNIVLSGCGAFDEDTWHALSWAGSDGASVEMKMTKPSSRCIIPAVDPSTGTRGGKANKDPNKALKQYRTGKILQFSDKSIHTEYLSSHKGDVFFGVHANCAVKGEPILRVGDALTPALHRI